MPSGSRRPILSGRTARHETQPLGPRRIGRSARPLERQPLNIQVAARLRTEILTGHRLPGEKLPNELDLSDRYAVSRATIREAIGMLVFAGLVERRHGSGTYVTQGHPPA